VARGRDRAKPAAGRQGPPAGSSASGGPWRLRFSSRILDEDLGNIGHAAYETAKKAIRKKLPVDPHQYGEGVRPPLDGIYKLKSSNVRVAYHIEEAAHEVWVLMIADRRVIWDRHEDEILGRLTVLREERRQRDTKPAPRPGRKR
jgi:mRNA-degrading endonuclease RelE of RelBE toxin-antitoxin system